MIHRTFGVVRVILGGIGLACLAAASAQAEIPENRFVLAPVAPLVVDGGSVVGKVLDGGVKAWLGIPFAAPPLHELRWKPPQPVVSWKGYLNADRLPPECIQPLRPRLNNQYYGAMGTNEDCLYLNVWAPPTAKNGDRLPVVVWIYGGGSTIGSGSIPLYDGTNIAKHGAVFVNFNYRVGILGYMAHPELTAESPHHASGNYGYLDMVAALQWIQRNITKFGGDPARVVIAGQSAGGRAVSTLQVSPMAKGLFGGVMGMSGNVWGNEGTDTPLLAQAEKTGIEVQSTLKLKSLADLRNTPADRLLALQEDCQLGCSNGNIRVGSTVIDGYFMPAQPAALMEQKRSSDVPVIAGYANDESRNELTLANTVAEFKAAAGKLYGANSAKLLELYPVKSDAEARSVGHDAARDGGQARSARNWAVNQRRYGSAPIYLYDLARVHPFNPAVEMADHPEQVGAYHNSDTPYFLGTLDALTMFRPTRIWTATDRQLSEKLMTALIAFARTGDPNTSEVRWSAWTPKNEQLLWIDQPIRMEPINSARLDFHQAVRPVTPTAVLATGARD